MSARCSGCGHVRSATEQWPIWQCPACLLPYETSRNLARHNESIARTEMVRKKHRQHRRSYLLLMFVLLSLQIGAAWAAGLLVPQLWLPLIIFTATLWLPIGLFGLRRPAFLWLPLWCVVSGAAIGTTLGRFQLTNVAVALSLTAIFCGIMLIVWAIQGKTPKRSTKVHRHSGIALSCAFLACVPLILFTDLHPFSALAATAFTGLIAAWMQFRVYRAARYHAVREPMPLVSATMFDWMTPVAWQRLWQHSSLAPDPGRGTGVNIYSDSESYGRRELSNLQPDPDVTPGAGNAIDSRPLSISDRLNISDVVEQHGPNYRPQRKMRKIEAEPATDKRTTTLKLVSGQNHLFPPPVEKK